MDRITHEKVKRMWKSLPGHVESVEEVLNGHIRLVVNCVRFFEF
jgi:hypothetical protein